MDDLNRAVQAADRSGCTTPLHVVTQANVEADCGERNIFDPGNGYRDEYAKVGGAAQ